MLTTLISKLITTPVDQYHLCSRAQFSQNTSLLPLSRAIYPSSPSSAHGRNGGICRRSKNDKGCTLSSTNSSDQLGTSCLAANLPYPYQQLILKGVDTKLNFRRIAALTKKARKTNCLRKTSASTADNFNKTTKTYTCSGGHTRRII